MSVDAPVRERRPNPWWEFTHRERRAPIQGGGTVAWWEHSLCWDAMYKAWISPHLPPNSEQVAAKGGFTISELETLTGRKSRTFVK